MSAEQPLVPDARARLRAALQRSAGRVVERFEASHGQRALWFLGRQAPASPVYNLGMALRLRGALDVGRLQRALESQVARHAALRSRFSEDGGTLYQEVLGFVPLPFVQHDAHAWSDAELRARVAHDTLRPYDPQAGGLVRASLYRRSGADHVLLLELHHLVCDGATLWQILLEDLGAAYAGLARAPAAEPAPSDRLFAEAQRALVASPEGERQRAYWQRQLAAPLPVLELPAASVRPALVGQGGGVCDFELDARLTATLRGLAREQGVTLFVVLLAAYQTLLARHAGTPEVVVGTPVSRRTRPELAGAAGFLVNTVALRGNLAGRPSFRGLLARTRDTVVDALAHADYPFRLLVEQLAPARAANRSPIYQALFVLQQPPPALADVVAQARPDGSGPTFDLGGLQASVLDVPFGAGQVDLILELVEGQTTLRALLKYDSALLDAAAAARLAAHYRALLAALVADPERAVDDVPLLGPEESAFLTQVEAGPALPASDACLHELFEAQAARTPERTAVVYGEHTLSYAALDAWAAALAARLVAAGALPERPVGILMQRCMELPVALYAVLKAGSAYLPLDPDYPPARLAFMLEDAGVELVIADAALASQLPASVRWLAVGEAGSVSAPRRHVDPDTLAYVIYTSGSTGQPKGTPVSHRAIAGRMRWMQQQLPLDASDRVLFKTSTSFDVSLSEIFWPLGFGASVVVAPPDVQRDPALLAHTLRTQQVTTVDFVPSMLAAFLASADLSACPSLRRVIAAGEALGAELVRSFHAGCDAELYNIYGPTEAAVYATWWLCPRPTEGDSVPIGRPLGDTQVYVLDPWLQRVAPGIDGELYLGGPLLARGYLGQPERTALRFVPDPFSATPGARLYRTGDRVRWRPDGALAYLGRIDHQLKVRGFRVEPGEIEAALLAHPSVREAAVVGRPDAAGALRLVAYLVGAGSTLATAAELRTFLARSLPEHLIPSLFCALPALPLSPNGKLDRSALPAPDLPPAPARAGAAASDPLQELVSGIYARVLGLPAVGPDADFFELGGHSLLAIQVVARLRETLGRELPIRTLFETPRVAALTARLAALGRPEPDAQQALLPSDGSRAPVASFGQERLWFLDSLQPDDRAYQLTLGLQLTGALDVELLRRSLEQVVERHAVLRTALVADAGRPRPMVRDPGTHALSLERIAPDGVTAALCAEAARGFDLAQGALLRSRLLQLAGDEHVLVLSTHHAAFDGWSLGILQRELCELYAAGRENRPARLPELSVQYADYAAWQRARLASGELAPELGYWRERLAGVPALDLPTDRPRPTLAAHHGARLEFTLGADLSLRLDGFAREHGLTPFMLLLAGLQVVLGRMAGQSDFAIGVPVAGRPRPELEPLIGMFVNLLPIRATLDDSHGFAALARRVREATLDAYAHQALPFERILETCGAERDPSRSPLFQVLLTLQNAPADGWLLAGLHARVLPIPTLAAKYDLAFDLTPSAAGYAGGIEYASALFDAGTVERIGRRLCGVLDAALAAPERPLGELAALAPGERALVLEAPQIAIATPMPAPVSAQVRARAAEDPARPALVSDAGVLDRATLQARAERLGRVLLPHLGSTPEPRVGMLLERSAELVIAELAALQQSAAFVPLDPALPDARLQALVDAASLQAIVTTRAHRGRVRAAGVALVLIDDAGLETGQPQAAAATAAADERLAYVVFTSGSTGVPKGVAISQQSLARLAEAHRAAFGVGPNDRVSVVASPAFDASIFEIWPALCAGATLHLASPALVADPARLRDWLLESQITLAWLPTPLAEAVMALLWPASGIALRALLIAGDRLTRRPPAGLPFRVFNLYGPTEDTVWSTLGEVAPAGSALPAIGAPVLGHRTYVLDARLEPVGIGVPGQLYLAGAGLARGYLDSPGQTASAFLPDPFAAVPGARMYRTGDRARWSPAGTLEFLGRADAQLKVRGVRVEPGEIEATLVRLPGVAQAGVRVVEGELAAWVVAADGAPLDLAALRARLAKLLPAALVPRDVGQLDALPLLPSGKLDRLALPLPQRTDDAAAAEPPRTPTEIALARAWSGVLRISALSRTADFFALGGHSLAAVDAAQRSADALGVAVPVRQIFETPRLCDLAAALDAAPAAHPPAASVALESPGLSYAQERLWFLERLFPAERFFVLSVALRLVGAPDLARLQRAHATLLERHPLLCARFPTEDGKPVRRALAAGAFQLGLEPLEVPPAARAQAVARLCAEEAARPFDLEHGPLLRVRLVRLAEDDHLFLLSAHHIVCDGASLWNLLADLDSEAGNSAIDAGFDAHVARQRTFLASPRARTQIERWRTRLEGAPVLELPTDRPRQAAPTGAGGVARLRLSAALLPALASVGRAAGATPYMTLLAAYAALLGRWTGSDDVLIGSPVAGRDEREWQRAVGLFANTLPLRVALHGRPTFLQLLERVRSSALAAQADAELPFEALVEELHPRRDLGRNPIVQTIFGLQEAPATLTRFLGVPAQVVEPAEVPTRVDLEWQLVQDDTGIHGFVLYPSALFEHSTVDRLIVDYTQLLEAALATPERPLDELWELSPHDAARLAGWNHTAAPHDTRPWVVGFAERARRTPDAVALELAGETRSYRELDTRANRIAQRLRRQGVGPEVPVGLCVGRTLDTHAAIIGIQKAGGAYVPLDPAYPAARLQAMIADAGLQLALVDASHPPALAEWLPTLVRLDDPTLDAESAEAPAVALDSDQLAYVLFTSGSEGRPKGVLVPHRGISNMAGYLAHTLAITPDSRVLQFLSLNFDASVWEYLMALGSGARLVLCRDDERLPGPALLRLLEQAQITHASIHPAALAEMDPAALPLQVVTTGGELCSDAVVAGWSRGRRLVNAYGPTEATCTVTMGDLAAPGPGPRTIGRPVPNLRVHVLGALLQPLPIGVSGELYVGGAGVVRGYLNQPALTAERFVPDPFGPEPGARLYRTGDRARFLADGSLEFLGRVDAQVKVRGFRVEPGEIEAALARHPGVRQAAVVLREEPSGAARLIGYVASDAGIAPHVLQEWLRQSLPEHMVPSAIVVLPELPRLPTGKLDRRALPAPEATRPGLAQPFAPPASPLEATLVSIWQQVLGLAQVGIDDGFFDLGGHSLLLVRIHTLIEQRLERTLPLVELFTHPTIRQLAAHLEQGADTAPAQDAVPEREDREALRRRLRERRRAGRT